MKTKAVAALVIAVTGAWFLPKTHFAEPPAGPITHALPHPPTTLTLDLGSGETMTLARIPAGKFMMGSPRRERGRDHDEEPQRQVTISKPFYIGIYEVTQGQYEAVMGENPSHFKGPRRPVECVSVSYTHLTLPTN